MLNDLRGRQTERRLSVVANFALSRKHRRILSIRRRISVSRISIGTISSAICWRLTIQIAQAEPPRGRLRP